MANSSGVAVGGFLVTFVLLVVVDGLLQAAVRRTHGNTTKSVLLRFINHPEKLSLKKIGREYITHMV